MLTDERLGQVLGRRDHRRELSEANPVMLELLNEFAGTWRRHFEEILDAGLFLIDVLGANERGGVRVGVHTASRVLAEIESTGGRDAYAYLASVTSGDVLLRLCVDATLAWSDRLQRRRTKAESDAVAVAMYLVLKMVRDQAEAGALERALTA